MNEFGNTFRVSIYGQSHSEELGVRIDGVPQGLELSAEDLSRDILRRSPEGLPEALKPFATPRREADAPEFRSGLKGGRATGGTLEIAFRNENARPEAYAGLRGIPRPGHADYPASVLAGWKELPSGGGAFSGRMTLPLVAAGAVAKKMLRPVEIEARLIAVGGSSDPEEWPGLLGEAASEGDSLGGVVECRATGLPVGLGSPFWDSVESVVSHAVFAIPGVRGIEFGDGFAASAMHGSAHNDPLGPDGPLKNGSGGVNGGLTNGAPLVFCVAFKPTSSISKSQRTWNFETKEYVDLSVRGRHDVCFALRTPAIVEAATAIALANLR